MPKYKVSFELDTPMMIELWEKLFDLAARDPENWEPVLNDVVFELDYQAWVTKRG